jgi:predicted amidophosphoribosyltransferase
MICEGGVVDQERCFCHICGLELANNDEMLCSSCREDLKPLIEGFARTLTKLAIRGILYGEQ